MSRTIRRKVVFDVNAVRGMYTWEWVEKEDGNVFLEKVWKEGEDKRVVLVKYHSDAYPTDRYENRKSSRKIQHHVHRSRARQQLIGFKKNPEVEVMIHTDPHLNYWC